MDKRHALLLYTSMYIKQKKLSENICIYKQNELRIPSSGGLFIKKISSSILLSVTVLVEGLGVTSSSNTGLSKA